jgi:hypothetical protein
MIRGSKKGKEEEEKGGGGSGEKNGDAKRLTMGILTANSIHSLSNPEFLPLFCKQDALMNKKEEKAGSGKRTKRKKTLVLVVLEML